MRVRVCVSVCVYVEAAAGNGPSYESDRGNSEIAGRRWDDGIAAGQARWSEKQVAGVIVWYVCSMPVLVAGKMGVDPVDERAAGEGFWDDLEEDDR